MTRDELEQRFPHASEQFIRANLACSFKPLLEDGQDVAPRLPAEESKPHRRAPLDRKTPAPKTREPSVAVIITRCSAGRLDRDNNTGAAKPLVDALRAAGYFPDDTEQDIELFVFQKKVKRKHVGTLIEIIPL